ncbi:hypothetical protein HK103_005887 [Boothiomyces macroporosus]|uniref:Uncharacterized protein n=1 Tax=Boothiomyces macroporosus TaxID=261099 RepID=A0AAD5UED6_9FUNG|nr:hypothetical protein HK103_005887 [Boothiomyces macroporosus]
MLGSSSEKLDQLKLLVSRAGAYSKFLADKLEVRQQEGLQTEENKDEPSNKYLTAKLRDYQVVGLEWLISLYENGLNGILADEMGLGKTLQTIAFLAHLVNVGTNGPFLIVAPLSTIHNWKAEFDKFTKGINVLLYHGTPKERDELRRKYMNYKTKKAYPIVITSYEICMNDQKKMKNNLAELWSLLNFLMPEIFNDLEAFEEWFEFGNNVDELGTKETLEENFKQSMVSSLHQILKPFLLRRIKTDVVLDLPKKREYLLYAPLTPKQKEIYEAILKKELAQLLENEMLEQMDIKKSELAAESESKKRKRSAVIYQEIDEEDLEDRIKVEQSKQSASDMVTTYVKKLVGKQNLQQMIMQLRKVCNHPYLFRIGKESGESDGIPEILAWSGKMLLLDRLLPKLLENGHKVLIFSQMALMLDIIAEYLEIHKKYKYCRIDGDVKLADRQDQIVDFNNNPDLKVFLLSTRAGGLGINLTAADTVIIFDSDWNPQADLQAQDRVHRIGQKKPVIVYRFVTANSVEKKIIDRAKAKRNLEKIVIHKTSALDLSDILKEETLAVNYAKAEDEQYIPECILTDDELRSIMDRSDEAYEIKTTDGRFDMVDSAEANAANNALNFK